MRINIRQIFERFILFDTETMPGLDGNEYVCNSEIYCCLDDAEGEEGDPNKDLKS